MDRFCLNLDSYKIYNFKVEYDEVFICRLIDNQEYWLTRECFKEKYRSLTFEEEELLLDYIAINEPEKVIHLSDFTPITKLKNTSSVGLLIKPENKRGIDEAIFHENVRSSLNDAINFIKSYKELNQCWGLDQICTPKCILNFYGLPGTGKTLAAKLVGSELSQDILHVDYTKIHSAYVGETGENISNIFEEAERLNAIILLDEADSIISKRGTSGNSYCHYLNQELNTLMQEIDKFKGVLILTTNLFGNFDSALNRRISHHIEFCLPNEEMRVQLIKSHIPKLALKNNLIDRTIDVEKIAKFTRGFSGGDILNLIVNSIKSAASDSVCKEKSILRESHLVKNIELIRASKEAQGMNETVRKISLI